MVKRQNKNNTSHGSPSGRASAPENTPVALTKATRRGCQGAHLDVQLTEDGNVVPRNRTIEDDPPPSHLPPSPESRARLCAPLGVGGSPWYAVLDPRRYGHDVTRPICAVRMRPAIGQQSLKRFAKFCSRIARGFRSYPGEAKLRTEDAIPPMATGASEAALEQWHHLRRQKHLDALKYNRFAKTCEALERWELHREVVVEGLERFPDDKDLTLRKAYCEAQRALTEGRWEPAATGFAALAKHRPLPFPISYYARQAALELELAGLPSDEERLARLGRRDLIREPLPEPAALAGLPNALAIIERRPSADSRLAAATLDVVHATKDLDEDLRTIWNQAHRDAVERLAESTSEGALHSLELPAPYNQVLSQHLMRYGHLDAYWAFRSQYIEGLKQRRLNRQSTPSYRELVDQITLANEEGDDGYFAVLQEVFERCYPKADIRQQTLLALSSLYHVKGHLGQRRLWPSADKEFAGYLSSKSIAIVGPVAGEEDVGKEIDGFDLVLRFNHRASLEYDATKFGSRTDLSWYAAPVFASAQVQDLVSGMNSLDYAVVGEQVWRSWKGAGEVTSPRRRRFEVWSDEYNPFLFGAPNGVQRTLLDLLRFSAGRIKVFNSNLFLSKDCLAGYRKSVPKNFFTAFTFHDPVANFALLKRLHLRGTIEVDEALGAVLSLSRRGYMERLIRSYSDGSST